MKLSAIALLLSLFVALAGCGSNSHPGNINGNWTATLTNPNGDTQFGFTTNFTQGSGNNLNIVNFQFTTAGPCFTGKTSETGSFGLAGDFNGNVTGQFGMTISTTFPNNNDVLTLQGAATGNTITGTWTLTGVPGCTGNGSFSMTHS